MREQSAIGHWLSAIPTRIRAAGRLGSRGGNWLRRGIAEGQQHPFGLVWATAIQIGERGAKRFETKIVFATRTLDTIKERGDFDEFVPGVKKVEVENLLACHTFRWRNYSGLASVCNLLLVLVLVLVLEVQPEIPREKIEDEDEDEDEEELRCLPGVSQILA